MPVINSSTLPRIDILQSFSTNPPPIDYVLPGMIAGTVGALVAPGGAGKSWLALQIAVAIAGGADTTGLGLKALNRSPAKVLYLAAEDPDISIKHRLHTFSPGVRGDEQIISSNLDIVCLCGRMIDIFDEDWSKLLRKMAEGQRLVILDTLRRFHLSDENNGAEMARLLAILESIAAETGASFLFLHHAGKGSAVNGGGDAQQASRGSSVLVDNVRGGQFNLVPMSEAESKLYELTTDRHDYVRLVQSKVNFDSRNADMWLERCDGGILEPVTLRLAEKPSGGRSGGGSQRGGRSHG